MGGLRLWGLLEVSSMPILQLSMISILGAFMATRHLNLLPPHARKSLNAIVFVVFTPSLIFASLAKTVRFQHIISWWFMPVNMGITFVVGGAMGWIVVKILRPQPAYLQDLIIAMCATGNFKNILLIIIPAMCNEDGSPFGDDKAVCRELGLSYVTFSIAIGSFYTWTYTYHLIRSAKTKYIAAAAMLDQGSGEESSNEAQNDAEEAQTPLLPSSSAITHYNPKILTVGDDSERKHSVTLWGQTLSIFNGLVNQLKAPPVLAAMGGFFVGSVSWLRNLIIGDDAPLRSVNESIKLLGDGTIPCITLILGGNLTQGLSKAQVEPWVVIAVICVRYLTLPITGIGVVKAASHLGFLVSDDLLYRFILLMQFALPPGINIGTMTQLFDVAQAECSMLYFWTYLVAAFALTGWSIVFMWILS